jgi:tetratricopeptide (TPR) repeat protein
MIQGQEYRWQPPAPAESKSSALIPLLVVVIALIALVTVFISGGDTATGVGRAGWVAVGFGAVAVIGFLVVAILRRTVLGFNEVLLAILVVLFAGLGSAGILLEMPLHNAQGDNFKNRGEYTKAVAEYYKGGDGNLTGKIPESYFLQGEQNLKNKEFEPAIQAYRMIQRKEFQPNPYTDTAKKQISTVYLVWGEQLESSGSTLDQVLVKYDEAIKNDTSPEAVEKAKANARALIFKRGEDELAKGNFQAALNTFGRTATKYGTGDADLKPYYSKTYLSWGVKLFETGDFEGALGKLEPNLAKYPDGAEVNSYKSAIVKSYAGIGKKLVDEKKFDEAINKLTPAFATYGTTDGNLLRDVLANAYFAKGDIAETAKDYAVAIGFYEKALGYKVIDDKQKFDLLTRLGRVHIGQGEALLTIKDFGKAIENFEKSLKYAPKDDLNAKIRTTYLSYGEDLIAQGQFATAISVLEQGQKTYSNPAVEGQFRNSLAKAHLGWGNLYEKTGDFQQALDEYKIVLAKYPELVAYTKPASDAQPRVLLGWAEKLNRDRNFAEAIKTYQEIIAKYGGAPQAQQARALLNAPQYVTIIVKKDGLPLANTRVRLSENWTFQGENRFTTSGTNLEFTTTANGDFTVQLAPNKTWLLSYRDTDGWITVSTTNPTTNAKTARNLVSAAPLRTTTLVQEVGLNRDTTI